MSIVWLEVSQCNRSIWKRIFDVNTCCATLRFDVRKVCYFCRKFNKTFLINIPLTKKQQNITFDHSAYIQNPPEGLNVTNQIVVKFVITTRIIFGAHSHRAKANVKAKEIKECLLPLGMSTSWGGVCFPGEVCFRGVVSFLGWRVPPSRGMWYPSMH